MDTRNTEFFPISTSVYILQRNTHIWSICPLFKYHNCWMVHWRRKWLEVLFECRAIFTRLDPYVISNNLESTVIVNIRLLDSRETVMTPLICLKHCSDTRRSFNIFVYSFLSLTTLTILLENKEAEIFTCFANLPRKAVLRAQSRCFRDRWTSLSKTACKYT